MTAAERVQAASRVLARHLPATPRGAVCMCGMRWHLKHQARELERAGLLCALTEVAS